MCEPGKRNYKYWRRQDVVNKTTAASETGYWIYWVSAIS